METEILNRTSMVFRAALTLAKNCSIMRDDPADATRGRIEPISVDGVAALVAKGDAHRPVFAPKMAGEGFEWRLSGNSFLQISFDAPDPQALRVRLPADKALQAAARSIGKAPEIAPAAASTPPLPAVEPKGLAAVKRRGLGPAM